MSKRPSLNRTEYLLSIQRDLEAVARLAETQPDLFSKIVSDAELEQIEKIVAQLIGGVEKEIKKA